DPGLALLDRLAPDEVLDVRMVGVEDDHLGGATRRTAGLYGAGRRVSAAHEAHRPRGGTAALEVLLRGAEIGQVDARPRTTLEDRAFLDVPVQDGLHVIVDVQDEARR